MATIYSIRLRSGATRYKAEVRLAGFPRRVKTFRRRTDARLWAQQVEAEARKNEALRRASFENRTLFDLFDLYRTEVLASFESRYRLQRETHLRFWERHPRSSLTPDGEARYAHLSELHTHDLCDSLGTSLSTVNLKT